MPVLNRCYYFPKRFEINGKILEKNIFYDPSLAIYFIRGFFSAKRGKYANEGYFSIDLITWQF